MALKYALSEVFCIQFYSIFDGNLFSLKKNFVCSFLIVDILLKGELKY